MDFQLKASTVEGNKNNNNAESKLSQTLLQVFFFFSYKIQYPIIVHMAHLYSGVQQVALMTMMMMMIDDDDRCNNFKPLT